MENSTNKKDDTKKGIEEQTIKIVSDMLFFTTIGGVVILLGLKCLRRTKDATFVGQWAAPILILCIYNKMIKQKKSFKIIKEAVSS